MSLEKAIFHGKEKRRPFYDSRRFDWSCKNHGNCVHCFMNRKGRHAKEAEEMTAAQIEEAMTVISGHNKGV